MWSVLAALHPGNHNSDRVREYQTYATELNFDGISFPMRMADIPKFEKQNQISVNVFGYEKGDVFPIHITTHRYDKHVYLLMRSDRKQSHFCWIKDLNRLLFNQKSCKIAIITVLTVFMNIPRRDYYRIIYLIARHTDLKKSNYPKRKTIGCIIKSHT
jgi:hypothetical protein